MSKQLYIITFILIVLCSNSNAGLNLTGEKFGTQISKETPDEIIFYSNGSDFSPVIVLEGNAQVLWTFDDNSTTNSKTPRKNYGTAQLRKNTLKVTPWSALRRINIGYDAQDGGSPEIELVANQHVSKVENLELVAPYLKEWCSSYNQLTSLDFSNFINLETLECYLSQSLQKISLKNTPKLKRACFVINALQNIDLSDCPNLQEVLIGSNKVDNIILPAHDDSLWYLGARQNPQLSNQHVFNDLSQYPNISHLSVWNSNQTGELIIHKTNPKRWVWIRAYENKYTHIDFRGSLQKSNEIGYVDLHKNNLTKVDIEGCKEIRTLDLSDNLLSEEMVDSVLMQLDEFGNDSIERYANLSKNSPPSTVGLLYKRNLEAKGWKVIVDSPLASIAIKGSDDFKVYPNPSHGDFKIHVNNIPKEGVFIRITDINGKELVSKKIYEPDTDWSIDEYPENIFFITLKGPHILETKKISKL